MADIGNNSQEFADDAVRRFLFGRLSLTEQSTFEAHLFSDDRLEARVRLAEFDLADDYAFARLSPADREAFERKFLLSAGRRRKLNVSSALRDRFASASTAATTARDGAKTSIGERLRLLFALNQRGWRFALGVMIFVVLIGTVWLAVKEPRIKEVIKARIFNRRAPAPAPSTPRMAGHSNNTSAMPEHRTTSSPMPAHDQTTPSPTIASVVLLPGASRDGDKLPRINLPKGEHDIVRLQLALKPNQTGIYRAELLTIDGQDIFSAQSLQSTDIDAGKLDFDVPAALLKAGDYQVKLSRAADGSKGSVASYYFRVQ
jgi:hypothetical protein